MNSLKNPGLHYCWVWVQCLKERSLHDKIVVSSSCFASNDLASSDMSDKVDLANKLEVADGNT
ncbi:uncharacterized protein BX663DRAFT_552922 [Cokeromyces recurvatus]|uniref:uncharacterized protein n=1 Tax=Cokeromyces recurvatus TaxID=90255 RepID=UPI0022211CAB|nr:uncharacterized protein BX663DRAFT_552922 [Cokeromyces recurvatus]KAI7901559.1 hypothetical protein BX663DRAFT_552922 [Cokeromyces recurvatus]